MSVKAGGTTTKYKAISRKLGRRYPASALNKRLEALFRWKFSRTTPPTRDSFLELTHSVLHAASVDIADIALHVASQPLHFPADKDGLSVFVFGATARSCVAFIEFMLLFSADLCARQSKYKD